MPYACDNCSYLFESNEELEQCPDCGKFAIRVANDQEIEKIMAVESASRRLQFVRNAEKFLFMLRI